MPRLTRRVFTDLAIWMTGFGIAVGLVFPSFCLLMGLPADRVLTPAFYASTLAAGLVVGAVNFGLARLVVGRRLRVLAERTATVEERLAAAVFSHDWAGCDPSSCALPLDSDDEVGASAAAFNRLIGTLARTHALETGMRRFSDVLSTHFELEGLGAAALDELLRQTGAQGGALFSVREGTLEPVACRDLECATGLASSEHVQRALRSGETQRLCLLAPEIVLSTSPAGLPAGQILVAPIAFQGAVLGVAILASAAGLEQDASQLLEQYRSDLGLAMNNALAHERLERLAAIDPLTDVFNRRFGLARLREELARTLRSRSSLGILMLDLDQFKAVNDTFGHLAGDRVLRAAAHAFRRSLRDGDVLVRYGGEEFLAILPGAEGGDVERIGERMRQAIDDAVIVENGQRIQVTVSLGGASHRRSDTPETLIARADSALYNAKAAGRNCLSVA